MIDGHIIWNEYNFNSFNVAHGFNTKARFSKRNVLMNLAIQNEWYKSKKSTRWTSSWTTIYWTLKNALLNFWIVVFVFILFVVNFFMIKYNYDVINLSIFVIHDV